MVAIVLVVVVVVVVVGIVVVLVDVVASVVVMGDAVDVTVIIVVLLLHIKRHLHRQKSSIKLYDIVTRVVLALATYSEKMSWFKSSLLLTIQKQFTQ